MPVNNSPNMNLPIPAVGIEPGPAWANDINNSLTTIDAHSHAPGQGVPVTPSGLNINIDLPFNSHSATSLFSSQYISQTATLSTPYSSYYVGRNYWITDGSGVPVQITSNGSVVGTPGSITGLTSPASASYSSSTFVFQSNANTAANIDGASILLRLGTASSTALTLSPPSSMVSNYTVTLPTLPASTLPLTIDSSGNMSATQITTTQLAPATQQALNPTGSIIAYGGASAPAGYLLCDGAAVSRTTYSALFAAIGTAFGSGDGTNTFNTPWLQGSFLRGVNGSGGIDPDAASRSASLPGGNTGNNVGSRQFDAMQGHVHGENVSSSGGSGSASGITGTQTQGVAATNPILPTTGPLNDGTNGAPRTSSETRPVNVYVTYIVKT